LVRLFHPDRHVNNPEAYKAYTRLTQEITTARDSGNIEKLREIANDPEGFARKIGASQLDFSEESQIGQLKRLYDSIQSRILEMLEALNELRSDAKYELSQLVARRQEYLAEVAEEFRAKLNQECDELEKTAENLANEIEELTGEPLTGF
jgi:DNA polymerase-3 subunit epsilon